MNTTTSTGEREQREAELDRALAEYLGLVDAGQQPEPTRFASGYPAVADELLRLLRTASQVDAMAGPVEPERAALDATTDDWPGGGSPRAKSPPSAVVPTTLPHVPRDPSEVARLAQAETLAPGDSTATRTRGGSEAGVSPPGQDEPFQPRRFGDYELLSLLGQGGMGVVYKALQRSINRVVAVKMIRAGQFATPEDLLRFYNEAKAAGRLGHPSIVTVHQMGQVDGHHYFSMDYIEGTTLAELAGSPGMTDQRAALYLLTVADAIQHAHESGILHRDLKPANVLIDKSDRPHVTDFGLAKLMDQDTGLTASGTALGTPGYMAPEQAAGRHDEMGPASDVYSMGAVLYAVLTGQPPFYGRTVMETIMRVIHDDPPAPRSLRSGISADLETICLKCLKKEPSERYPTAAALSDDLRRFLAGEPIAARPAGRFRRGVEWVARIPLVAALFGRRVHQPTVWQRRANWALLALPLLVVMGLAASSTYRHYQVPSKVRIATAVPGGEYHDFGLALADAWRRRTGLAAEVIATAGSVDNVRRLANGESHLALLQASAVGSDSIAVAAPLYDDFVHVVIRRGRGIARLEDLAGKRIALGESGSGMQQTAIKLLQACGIDPRTLSESDQHFVKLFHDPDLDGAIVTTGTANADLRRLLASGDYDLLPVTADRRLNPAAYHPGTIPQGCYLRSPDGSADVPGQDIATIATTTFLAVHAEASDRLVRQLLETLYEGHLVARFDLIPREQAADWSVFHFHPAARRFFQQPIRPPPERK
ncbi:MAG: TAXI family TRAP transporter solute-binding subunit [Pirellulaceae bacterium]|nr:TAXI family TRAP transporter solute-binding subunit [Pirellulaceae bacterium]